MIPLHKSLLSLFSLHAGPGSAAWWQHWWLVILTFREVWTVWYTTPVAVHTVFASAWGCCLIFASTIIGREPHMLWKFFVCMIHTCMIVSVLKVLYDTYLNSMNVPQYQFYTNADSSYGMDKFKKITMVLNAQWQMSTSWRHELLWTAYFFVDYNEDINHSWTYLLNGCSHGGYRLATKIAKVVSYVDRCLSEHGVLDQHDCTYDMCYLSAM